MGNRITVKAMTTQSEPGLTDGFHLIVHALKLNGVDTIYGLVGIPITDLARLAQKSGIRFIGFRHTRRYPPATPRPRPGF